MVGVGPQKGASGSFNFAIENMREINDALNTLSKHVDDLRVPLTIIAADFYRSQRSIFMLRGPGRYKDLSPEYKKRKKKTVGFIYPIMVGSSRRIANSTLGKSHPDSIFVLQKNLLEIGSSTPYLKYHQSDRPRSKMPLRKVLFIDGGSGDRDLYGRRGRWLDIINTHIAQVIEEKWG